ncbi:protein argonaute-2-like [Neocloeon triangulifer]|uniref:protein argonaute-2-like n=1 Tax=Neocloeon triangulifer TaxID=2078957 RepID=UPI00286F5DF4|nr:protein argonaute-2-like [Neocloeon triangulifer]XP_059482471.1 protein argonaute-2-like [Neocloeon triangulifer]
MGGKGRGRGRARGRGQPSENFAPSRPGPAEGHFPPIPQLSLGAEEPTRAGWARGRGRGNQPLISPREEFSSSGQSLSSSPATSQTSSSNPSTPTVAGSSSGSSAPSPEKSTGPVQQVITPRLQPKFPARNGYGTKGQKMIVETNHFTINVKNKQMTIIHYDVDMKLVSEKDGSTKDCPKKYFKPAIVAFGKIVWPGRYPAFDGVKNLFSCKELIDGETQMEIQVQNKERFTDTGAPETAKIKVKVKRASEISLADIGRYFQNRDRVPQPQAAIQALDIVLRNSGITRLLQVGRSFYTAPKGEVISLGNGMELWYGVFQSAGLGAKQIYLNVDVAHKGFPKAQSVRDLVIDLGTEAPSFNNKNPRPFDVVNWELDVDRRLDEKFRNYIKGLKVEYEIPHIANSKRVYRVVDVVQAASQQKFTLDMPNGGKQQLTVAAYYEREKRCRLQYPYWPCLHVGSKDRQIYVPMELCKIAPNQVTIKKLDEEQTRNMVRNAATKPYIRKKKIMDAFNSLELARDPCLAEFGIQVSGSMTPVDGRILNAPALKYQGEQEVRVQNGEWKMNNQKFQKPCRAIKSWAIVDLCGLRETNDIASKFPQFARDVGMTFEGRPQMLQPQNRFRGKPDLDRYLEDVARKGTFDLMIVVIPDYIGGVSPYPSVKQILEMKFKILTQCIKMKTVRKLTPPTIGNILLKINAKMDGINHSIHTRSKPSCFNEPIMIMGADVTHPPPDSKSSPSVAAVTASHDPVALFQYNMQWRLQPPKCEEILDMEEITYQHLRYFATKTGYPPKRIIFYRDGVSDGQFEMVLRCELGAIRRAVKRFKPEYNPPITFLVVQKRHHTRFFPRDRDPLADRNGNVPAGFVVDQTITHPRNMDFYLVSHQSIQGTSRPTKYQMLWDDANMTEDQVEELTYYLCHLFTRCNRSVSYPAPTYYSHLAAFRAKNYIEGKHINVADELALKLESIKMNEAMIEFNKKHPMFFV